MPGGAAQTRYGNRGGGWVANPRPETSRPGERGSTDPARRRVVLDRHALNHPAVIAQDEAHRSREAWCPADGHSLDKCRAPVDPERLDLWWRGRARMALARLADWRRWLTLDDTDIAALAYDAGAPDGGD